MKQYLTTILFCLCAVLVTILVMTFFRKTPVSEEMIVNREKLKYIERDRIKDSIAFQQRLAWYDSSLTASQNRVTDLENKKTPIRNAIKTIPGIISNYDREQLRKSFTDGQ